MTDKSVEKLNIEELMDKYNTNKKKINDYYYKKYILENENDQIRNVMYKKCTHNWIVDSEICDEHTIYKCSICGLWRR
jgi:predicted  nucleic acid-binding Zn ribbon protein